MHVHSCTRCGETLYRCREAPIIEDSGTHCPNDHEGGEFCDDCRDIIEAEVNAAMHDDEDDTSEETRP